MALQNNINTDDDTFSSEDTNTYTTFKNKKNGELVSFPSKFDPKTGEDLTLTKVRQNIPDLTPVKVMSDNKGNYVPVPFERIKEFTDLGLKPVEQMDLENQAKQERKDILAGGIDYHPNKTESFWRGAAQGASANTTPNILGAYEGAKNVLKGGEFKPAYERERDLQQSLMSSAENENPLTYTGGELLGGTGTAAVTGGASITPRMLTAGLLQGGISGAAGASNNDESLQNILNKGTEGAIIGGGSVAAGPAVGKILGVGKDAVVGLGNVIDKYLPQQSRNAFKESIAGNHVATPEVQDAVRTMSANMAKEGPNVIDKIRSVIGEQKGDLIEASPVMDHTPILKSIQDAQIKYDKLLDETGHNLKIAKAQQPFISAFTAHDQELNQEIARKNLILKSIQNELGTPDVVLDPVRSKELKEAYQRTDSDLTDLYHAVKNNQQELTKSIKSIESNPTYWTEQAKPILKAKEILNDAVDKLQSNPNSTRMVDELKQTLGQKIYVDNIDVTKTFAGKKILEDVRKSAQTAIEDHIPEIGNKNQAYKDILHAVSPEEVHDKILLDPAEIESITSGKPTPNAYLKFNNFNEFNKAVQENPQINPEEKQKLANYISDMLSISKLSNIAKGVQAGQGKIPAKLGAYLDPNQNILTGGLVSAGRGAVAAAKAINGVPLYIYNKAPEKIQKLIQSSPKFAADYLRTIPRGAAMEAENKSVESN